MDRFRILRLNVGMKSTGLAIGDVAQRFGLATHVLRHWESMGLLAPARYGGRRRYADGDLYRVAAILRGKRAGLSLEQIQQMLTTADPGERVAVLRAQRAALQHRIAATEEALELIDHALTCRHADFTRCPTYRRLIAGEVSGGARRS